MHPKRTGVPILERTGNIKATRGSDLFLQRHVSAQCAVMLLQVFSHARKPFHTVATARLIEALLYAAQDEPVELKDQDRETVYSAIQRIIDNNKVTHDEIVISQWLMRMCKGRFR